MTPIIGIEALKQLIRLEPETGRLFWLPRGPERFVGGKYSAERLSTMFNRHYAGKEALSAPHPPYRSGRIMYRHYMAHVVVFALAKGRWPEGDVDHKDGDKTNNIPTNLREATRQQNNHNSGSRGGSSQYCGVVWHKGGRKWMAYCNDAAGKRKHLGMFADEADAARAYDAAAAAWHGDFARLNFPPDNIVQSIRTYQNFKQVAA